MPEILAKFGRFDIRDRHVEHRSHAEGHVAARKKSGSKKRSRKTSSKKSNGKRTRRQAKPLLSAAERRTLLAARENHDEHVPKIVRAWSANRGVRVAGLSPARLTRLSAQAERTKAKEEARRAELEARLAPLVDARMKAEDALQRAVLELWAEVKHRSRREPALIEAFESLREMAAPTAGTTRGPEQPEPPLE